MWRPASIAVFGTCFRKARLGSPCRSIPHFWLSFHHFSQKFTCHRRLYLLYRRRSWLAIDSDLDILPCHPMTSDHHHSLNPACQKCEFCTLTSRNSTDRCIACIGIHPHRLSPDSLCTGSISSTPQQHPLSHHLVTDLSETSSFCLQFSSLNGVLDSQAR